MKVKRSADLSSIFENSNFVHKVPAPLDIPEYPASYAECISVSALRYDNTIPAYSNYGQYISVCAPGGDLSLDQNFDGFGDGILQQTHNGFDFSSFYYFFMEGTSPAFALVSGVAALIVSKSTVALSPLQVIDILQGPPRSSNLAGRDTGKDRIRKCRLSL
ncbi:MAG: S8 family serine peptidase [Deltaproteobacteria bacterium]|nr:S8 family serine peptidase [Deltaproteobacteria bacterium]